MSKTVDQLFVQFLQTHRLNPTQQQWLVATSGGIDSVVLCHLCKVHHISFAIAHCNFKLRAEESERDAAFVKQLAQQLNVPLFTKEFDTLQYMADTGKSVQVAARELRYQWFTEQLQQLNLSVLDGSMAPYVLATAHHATDNIETILMNLFRGTGIKGMRGIKALQSGLIRPILGVNKEAIFNYAADNNLTWVEDSSNKSDKYTRNIIRNRVLPLMEQAIPRQETGIEQSIEMMAETEQLYDQAIASHKKKLLEKKGHEIHIPVLKLAAATPLKTIVYEIISEFGFTSAQVADVLSLLQSESGKYVSSGTHRIIRNRGWLIIATQKTEQSGLVLIEKGHQHIVYSGGELHLQSTGYSEKLSIPTSAHVALLDAATIQYPLLLRPWKAGDYFYPLGMTKKKKLARFFIDQKLTFTEKEKIWVLESAKKIVWVVGYRINERNKVTPGTKTLQIITFKS